MSRNGTDWAVVSRVGLHRLGCLLLRHSPSAYNECMVKDDLRRVLLHRRVAVTAQAAAQAGHNIVKNLDGLPFDLRRAKSIHVYRSSPSLGEVSTAPLIKFMSTQFPGAHILIGETSRAAAFPTEAFDVVFVPVVGFDRYGFRLGMGGGWYDRWLLGQSSAYKIGLAYGWAEQKKIPHQPHDIPLDMIVTPLDIIVAPASAR